uniref:S-acyltransferase n=1 Tax=Kalanchoe fedtschenkoi TaxID=63787 RepID=A0A7N0TZI5_KALFE
MYVAPPPPPSKGSDLRVYQTWKGSNIFLLQGRFISGPDVRSLGITLLLIVLPVVIFCVFVARKLMDNFYGCWGVSILRNYRFFFMFVFSTTLLCIYVFTFCRVYIKKIMVGEDITIWKAMIKTPASIVLIIYTFISMWFVGGLTAFHLYLISTNQTTYKNFTYRCGPSKNKFWSLVPRETPPPSRPGVAGFMSPYMGMAIDDSEMGRKTVWNDMDHDADRCEGQLCINDGLEGKDGVLGEDSL